MTTAAALRVAVKHMVLVAIAYRLWARVARWGGTPDTSPIIAARFADTLGYDLSQGEVSGQRLYDNTTEYLRHVYNKAKMLNRSAAQLAK